MPRSVMLCSVEPVTLADLEPGLDAVAASPGERGLVELIVRRPAVDEREVLDEATLDVVDGLVGDSWRARGGAGGPNPGTQLTLMNSRTAALVAGPSERWPLAGDQLYVDFDLSEESLPPGTRLQVGDALVEVSAEPHRGCGKFAARFGVDALKLVNSTAGRALNLRGVNARVVEGGRVRAGDPITRVPV
jgi:MOSC domain-containing protein YiiM